MTHAYMTGNGNTEYDSLSLGITLVMGSHNHAVFWEDKIKYSYSLRTLWWLQNSANIELFCWDSWVLYRQENIT